MYKKLKYSFYLSFAVFYVLQMVDFNNENINGIFRGVLLGIIFSFCICFFFMGYSEKKPAKKETS
jgi:hypothetical protein